MKSKIYVGLVVSLIFSHLSFAYENDSTKKDSSYIKKAKIIFTEYDNLKSVDIGMLYMVNSKVDLIKPVNNSCIPCPDQTNEETVTINRVYITIGSGTISTINVDSDRGIFYNHDAGISLPHFYEREEDKLCDYTKNKCIRLGDFLSYKQDYGYRYMPSDTAFYLEVTTSTGSSLKVLSISNNANALFDARVYTDFLGLFGNEANGVVQTEIASRIQLNTQNMRNTKWYWVSYIKPSLKYARLDNQFQTIDINQDTVNRVSLYRQANFTFGSMINLIKYNHQEVHNVYFDLGYFASSTALTDKKNNAVISHLPIVEAGWTLRRISQLGIDVNAAWIPYFISGRNDIKNTSLNPFWRFQFTISWNPVQFKKSAFFLRYTHNYFINIPNSSFSQLQFGYSFNINDYIK